KQRIRWYRGFIENTIKHSDLMLNRKFPHIGFFIFPIAYVTTFIGICFLALLILESASSIQIFIKNFLYIPVSDQVNLAYKNLLTFDAILFSPYYLISFMFIFSTSFALLLYSLKSLSLARKTDIVLLPLYMLGYYFLIMIFWCSAFFMELFRWKKRW
ncbi:MAG TPA: hypothetical protein VJ343_01820, partial [archaeon]|nr:hypothetical protein [archaeon]